MELKTRLRSVQWMVGGIRAWLSSAGSEVPVVTDIVCYVLWDQFVCLVRGKLWKTSIIVIFQFFCSKNKENVLVIKLKHKLIGLAKN